MFFLRSVDLAGGVRVTYSGDIDPLTALALVKTGNADISILKPYEREFNSFFARGREVFGQKIYCRLLSSVYPFVLEEVNSELDIYGNNLTESDYHNIINHAIQLSRSLQDLFPLLGLETS